MSIANQLTTIAALPSGAGQAAHLEPEVGKARSPEIDAHPFQAIVNEFAKLLANRFVQESIAAELMRNPLPLGRWQQQCRIGFKKED